MMAQVGSKTAQRASKELKGYDMNLVKLLEEQAALWKREEERQEEERIKSYEYFLEECDLDL